MDNNRRLAVILLNWNNTTATEECLCMISAWGGLKPVVIIVDNGSYDERLCRQTGKWQEYIFLNKGINTGYAGGNNSGIRLAMEMGFKYIMLLNSDATIDGPCVTQLLECMDRISDVGVLGPLIREHGKIFAGGRNIGIFANTRIPYIPKKGNAKLHDVDYIPGTVFLAKSETFGSAGLLDEKFFFSGEIADFCRRVRGTGMRCTVYEGCQAIHTPDEESMTRETLYNYYNLRNRFLFIRKYFKYSEQVFFLRWVAGGICQILLALITGRRKRAHALWLGLKDGVSGRFGDGNNRFIW